VSIRLFWRRGLLALAGATALAVAAPAVASAAVTGLTTNPASVPAGSNSTSLTVNYTFNAAPSSLVTHLPMGLLANGTIDGGACLITPASNTPPAACQVGTTTVNGAPGPNAYLVKGPNSSTDLAGLELAAGGTNFGVADVTSRSSDGGLDISFSAMPPGVTSLSITFTGTDLRMPTNCPGENISAATNGQSTPFAASPALTVTGCSSLAYNPNMTATVKKDASDNGAEVISAITQPGAATESASKSTVLGFGSTLSPDTAAIAACFVSPCQVGTASATSPLLPNAAFSGGTVTLGGNIAAPTLTITFPVLHLSLVGAISISAGTVTFSNEPDFPLSSLNVDVTGTSSGKAFNTTCQPGNLTGAFTPWSGTATVNRTAPITYQGCPAAVSVGKPIAVGVLTGLAKRQPKLKVKVKRGMNAPNLKSVALKPPRGLSFKCVKSGKSCKGLSVTGAVIKSAKVTHGQLVVTVKKPTAKLTLTAKGPLLRESKALQTKVQKHKVKTLTFTLKVKDAKGTTTKILLKLKS
jgi:hypothetical protein